MADDKTRWIKVTTELQALMLRIVNTSTFMGEQAEMVAALKAAIRNAKEKPDLRDVKGA